MRRLALALLSLCLITVSGYELLQRYRQTQLLFLETDPLQSADSLLAQQRWQEARYLSDIVVQQPGLGDTQRARSIGTSAEAALDSMPIQARAFIHGALSGEASNGAGLLGALALDLFIIGDLRDLAVQGYREIRYEDGDTIILALSATGLGLALLPEIHWAPSLLKALKRSGALSERFVRMLYKHSRSALNTGNFVPLARIVNDFGSATRTLGPGPLAGAMRAVKTESDMARLAAAARINPHQAYAVTHLAGTRGLRKVQKNGRNIGSVTGKLKVSSRLAKSVKKSLVLVPSAALIALLLFGTLVLIILLRSRSQPALEGNRAIYH